MQTYIFYILWLVVIYDILHALIQYDLLNLVLLLYVHTCKLHVFHFKFKIYVFVPISFYNMINIIFSELGV
jgi:hypothetical protein